MLIPCGEEDAAGLVADEALGDAGLAEAGGGGAALVEDSGGGEDLDGEGVTGGAGLELVDLREDGLPHPRLRRRSRRRCLRPRHWRKRSDRRQRNPNKLTNGVDFRPKPPPPLLAPRAGFYFISLAPRHGMSCGTPCIFFFSF